MSWVYLTSILVPLVCMGLVDRRWQLFLFRRPLHAVLAVLVGVGLVAANATVARAITRGAAVRSC